MNEPKHVRGDAALYVQAVTPDEIVRQRDQGWPDFHPEDFCHLCGRRNIVWFVNGADWADGTSQLPRGGSRSCARRVSTVNARQ